ncbi:MAG: flagellar biosynthesis protein FlhF, partial [Bacteroidota bacterium]
QKQPNHPKDPKQQPPQPMSEPKPDPRPAPTPEPKPPIEQKAELPIELGPKAERTATIPVAPEPSLEPNELNELKASLDEMKGMLAAVSEHLENQPRGNWTPLLQRLYDRMLRAEIDPILARGFIAFLARQEGTTLEELIPLLRDPIKKLVKTSGPIEPGQAKTIALVGPTGVGKTTTIAKLAANFRLHGHHDIALITIDTYRVAAVEQLKTYGDIIGIPVEIVTTPTALREALHTFRSKEIVLIDTAGRSPSNKMHLNELKGFLDHCPEHEIHLVLSATTNRANLKRIYESFQPVGVDQVIVTKLDEACSFGAVFSSLHQWGKPVSYFTTGQSVPDDIRVADADYFTGKLLGELLP